MSANIAEGAASTTAKEFKMFLGYSIRSIAENISEFAFAEQQDYITKTDYDSIYVQAEILIKRITAFRKTIT